ncbi:autotransporter domain-containing protein [Candidatus Tisiphia endosymbiont of Beris chalybata]|uniref:autotransporter domain-containing protein n=1 Tax=Candidatus Tisiphia endosymbiont of Beris chalybata TaxID=3066262 RepID=UPI00312C9DA5
MYKLKQPLGFVEETKSAAPAFIRARYEFQPSSIPLCDDFAARRDKAKPIDNRRALSSDACKFIAEEYIEIREERRRGATTKLPTRLIYAGSLILFWGSIIMSSTYTLPARALDSSSSDPDASITASLQEEKISQAQERLEKLQDKLKDLSRQKRSLQYTKEKVPKLHGRLEQLSRQLGATKHQLQNTVTNKDILLCYDFAARGAMGNDACKFIAEEDRPLELPQKLDQTLDNIHREFNSITEQQTLCQNKLSIVYLIKTDNIPSVMTPEYQQYYQQYEQDPTQFDIKLLEEQVKDYERQKEILIRKEEQRGKEKQKIVNNAPNYKTLSIEDNNIIKNIQTEYNTVTKELTELDPLLIQYEKIDQEHQKTVEKIRKKQQRIRVLYNTSFPKLPAGPELSDTTPQFKQKLEFTDISNNVDESLNLGPLFRLSVEESDPKSVMFPSPIAKTNNGELETSKQESDIVNSGEFGARRYGATSDDVPNFSSIDYSVNEDRLALPQGYLLSSTPKKNSPALPHFQDASLEESIVLPIQAPQNPNQHYDNQLAEEGRNLREELQEMGLFFSTPVQPVGQRSINTQSNQYSDNPSSNDRVNTNLNNSAVNVNNVASPPYDSLESTSQIERDQTNIEIILLSDDFAARHEGAKPIDNRQAMSNEACKFISEEYINDNNTDLIGKQKLNSSALPMKQQADTVSPAELFQVITNASNTLLLAHITQVVNNILTYNIVNHRINLINAVAAGDKEKTKLKGLWISSLYGANRLGMMENIHSYKGNNYGAIIGLDFELNDRKELLGIAYNNMHFLFKFTGSDNKKISILSHGVTLYHHKELSSKWTLHSIMTTARNYIMNKLVCNIARVKYDCRAKHNNTHYNIGTKINYKIPTPTVVIMPNVGIRYGYYQNGPYIDSNVGKYHFSIASNKYQELIGIMGARAVVPSLFGANSKIFTLTFHGSIEHNFCNKNKKILSKVTYISNNTEQVINLPKPPKVSYNVGASILYEKNNVRLITQYNYYLWRKYSSHQGAVTLKLMF